MVDVHYSTERPKADQSPYESMEAGMASCSGLSILLIDACRSVGIPARFTGTALWYNESGNHSWVEFWDDGWHYTGAAEPTGEKVDVAWFDGSAAMATKGHPKHAIFAVTWNETGEHFPLVWLPEVKTYGAIDVTTRYATNQESELVPIRVRATDENGKRKVVHVIVANDAGELILDGNTKNDNADANDHSFLCCQVVQIRCFLQYFSARRIFAKSTFFDVLSSGPPLVRHFCGLKLCTGIANAEARVLSLPPRRQRAPIDFRQKSTRF